MTPEDVVLNNLKSGVPKSIKELSNHLCSYSSNPERLAREIAWKLIEQGKAKFNNNWYLEIK